MRAAILSLALIPALALAQTAPQPAPPIARPAKVPTSEQIASRAALKTYDAKADHLRARAKSALAAETARESQPICPNAGSTVEVNNCVSHEMDITNANLKAFTTALRELLALPSPPIPGATYPIIGPSGPEATPATNTVAFDATETSWRAYAKAECDAEDTEWRGGTIVNVMDGQCELRQSRARLRELRTAYDEFLAP